jgi:hypothetical protein
MDIYGTPMLSRVVQSLKRPQRFFLDKFFPAVETSQNDTIFFDVELAGEKRRLAPYVHPLTEGKLVEAIGYETKSFKPAYIKSKVVHDPTRPFVRLAGENIGTGQTMSPMQRREAQLARDLREMADMLTRRLEYMAVEALRDGQIVVKMLRPDATSETVTVDFGRSSNCEFTLSGATLWGATGVKPTKDLETWAMAVLKESGSSVRTLIHDPDAWQALRDSTGFEKKLDLRRVISGEINIGLLPEFVQYKGNDGTFDHWVYAERYWNPDASPSAAEASLLDSGRVIGVGDVLGVRHFGAIKDEEAGFQPMEYYTKSWTIPDPSTRILLMQSAPLMVPYRINASFSAKVLA